MTRMAEMEQADAAIPGRVGPNAVLQLVAALEENGLGRRVLPLFAAAGAVEWLRRPPASMVDERRVARLHQTLRSCFTQAQSQRLLEDAGLRTANYLLHARIPRWVQQVLKRLPPALAARVLVAAIRKNAWTFAGSGRFTARVGRTVTIRIEGNPFCAGEMAAIPVCHWHCAVFQHLFEVLVSPTTRVVETHCEAACGSACCFEISW